jgi:hypothetical protein
MLESPEAREYPMVEDPKSKVTRSEAPLRYGDVDLIALAERLARGEIPVEFAVAALAEAERVFAHGARLIKAEIEQKKRERGGV